MTTLTNQSLALNSRVSVAAGIAFTLNVPTPYATIIAISSDEYTVQFDNGTITTVYAGDITLLEEGKEEAAMIIEEVKETAKKIRAALKETFPGVNFQVKTQNKTILLRWNDFPVLEEMEQFLNTFKTNYDQSEIAYKVGEFDLNREFSREYMNQNKDWSKERSYKTLKWESSKVKIETVGTAEYILCKWIQSEKKWIVEVTLSNGSTRTIEYTRSKTVNANIKQIVRNVLEQERLSPSSNLRYSWDLTA